MIDNAHNTLLNQVFESEGGIKWYAHVNPLQISASRGVAAAKAKRFVDMMISESELKRLIAEQKKAAKEMDVIKVYAIVNEIDIRLNFLAEENSIIDLICIYFMLQDEDPMESSDKQNAIKREIIATESNARAFFLTCGKHLTERFNDISEADLLSYLEENKAFADRINQFFSTILETSTTS